MFLFDPYRIIMLIKNIKKYNRQRKENNKYQKLINFVYYNK